MTDGSYWKNTKDGTIVKVIVANVISNYLPCLRVVVYRTWGPDDPKRYYTDQVSFLENYEEAIWEEGRFK